MFMFPEFASLLSGHCVASKILSMYLSVVTSMYVCPHSTPCMVSVYSTQSLVYTHVMVMASYLHNVKQYCTVFTHVWFIENFHKVKMLYCTCLKTFFQKDVQYCPVFYYSPNCVTVFDTYPRYSFGFLPSAIS